MGATAQIAGAAVRVAQAWVEALISLLGDGFATATALNDLPKTLDFPFEGMLMDGIMNALEILLTG